MIEFDNRQSIIDFTDHIEKIIELSVNTTLSFEGFDKPCEISVVITDNIGIKEINKDFRNIDKETDVLSFPMLDFEEGYYDEEEIEVSIEDINPNSGEVVLGDIVISLEKAFEQSKDYGHSFDREIAFLTVHSALHLLGYDHEKDEDRVIMRSKEEEILGKLGLFR
jgi:probable rRNA maturation factor